MTQLLETQLLEVDLGSIAQEVWAAMLGIDLQPEHTRSHHDPDDRVVTGVVQITGSWTGAVTVQTTERAATGAAAALFMMGADEIGAEEVADTVGELANVVGGNVKSALPGDLQLSLPAVTSGRDYQVAVSGTQVRDRLVFDATGDLLIVTLLEQAT